jgi:NitT/TauT family transport system permease protein
VAWIPLAILMFPSSEGSMVFITFVGALFPILLNTVHGVEGVDPRLVAAARSLGTRRWRLFTEVIGPGAAPSIVTGLSIGMGTCWFCLVTAEMIAGQFGIGYYTWESYTVQRFPEIVVGMLAIGALGMGSSALVRAAGARLMPWYRPQRGAQ